VVLGELGRHRQRLGQVRHARAGVDAGRAEQRGVERHVDAGRGVHDALLVAAAGLDRDLRG
jgi:hypothetical protein